jgi:hypothetical protein
MVLEGEILVIIYDGISKTNKQVRTVPTFKARIYSKLISTGATFT